MCADLARGAPAGGVKRTAAADIFLSLQEPAVLDFSGRNAERDEAPELQHPAAMRVAMQRKSVVRQRPTEDLNAQVLRLWNRRYFEERLAEEESRSRRAGASRRFSVLVVDINDFKGINDQHGHPVGDQLLKWAGEFLHTHLRTHDVACRTGGDEFAVLLPDVSGEDAARLVARLREQLVVANRAREIPLGMSLGTATWPDVGATRSDLIAHADEEMYADKRRQKAAAEAIAAAAPARTPKPRAVAPARPRAPKAASRRAKSADEGATPAPLPAPFPIG
jgi:diguanylate cyclase (GGDEF)-like protein